MDSPLNIDTYQAPQQSGLSIDTGGSSPPVSSETADMKAAKVRFGVGGFLGNPTHQDLYQSIVQGQESSLRKQAASAIDTGNLQQQHASITSAASLGNTQAVQDAAKPIPPTNPDSVFEKGYAASWLASMNVASDAIGSSFLQKAEGEEPDYIKVLGHVGHEALSKAGMTFNAIQDGMDAYKNQSTGSWLLNEIKGLVPFYEEYKMRGNVPGVGFFAGGLMGEDLDIQARRVAEEPLEQYQVDFPRIYNKLKDADPAMALKWALAVHGMSTNDVTINDIFSAIQVAPIPGLPEGIGAIKSMFGFRQAAADALRGMTKDGLKTLEPLNPNEIIPNHRALVITNNMPSEFALNTAGKWQANNVKAAALEAGGDIKGAAVEKVASSLEEDMKGPANPVLRAVDGITTNFRADQAAVETNTGNFTRDQVLKIFNSYGNSVDRLIDTVTKTMRTMRVNLQTASRATIKVIQDDFRRSQPGLANRIVDVTDPILEPVSNTWHMGMNIVNEDGQLFSSPEKARISANYQDFKGSYEVRPKGSGFYIRAYGSLDENSDPMKDLLVATDNDKSPVNWVNAIAGYFRSPEDTMSKSETTARRLATYPQAVMRDMVSEDLKKINDLSQGLVRYDPAGSPIPKVKMKFRAWGKSMTARQGWKEWQRVVAATREIPDVNGQTGVTFKTVGEWQDFFFRIMKRPSTMQETEAYFAKNRLDLYDHALRNMAVYSNKASLGARTIQLMGLGKSSLTRSDKFDAVPHKGMPGGDFGIWVADETGSSGRAFSGKSDLSRMGTEALEKLTEDVKQGKAKVFEIWAPEQRPLQNWGTVGDQRIRYVISRHIETSDLSWDQVPRRGGGHFDYDYNHYVKQAKIRKSGGDAWYEGDTTLMPITIRKMGADIADKMNTFRELLAKGDEAAAKEFSDKNLPMEWAKMRSWFISDEGKPTRFDLHEPFMVVPKDQLISKMQDNGLAGRYKNFRDGTREGSLNSQFQVHYTGERDSEGMFTFKDIGTRNNPVYQMEPAALIDPIVAMNKGLNNIMHSTFMNDYKRYAANHWLEEVKGYMGTDAAKSYRSAPFYYFSNPKEVFTTSTPIQIKNQFMNNWQKIQQFIGQPSAFDAYLHNIEQDLMDAAYTKLGPKSANIPIWLIGKTRDPVEFVRKMAFHAYLGLFNPAQFLVQNQTWSNIWAISPRSAGAGTMGAMLHQWSRHNMSKEILEDLGRKAEGMGYKPGEWLELREAMGRTGFEFVEGEQAMLDTPMDYKFIKNDMNNFLDLGQTFFREGVKNVRLGAWYTAGKEFRHEHPTGKLTESDIAEILNRADRYHANMSRASSSLLNRGAFSLPFQFLTYQIRLAELMVGKRLGDTPQARWAARARMVGLYSALYGVPMSIGLTGLPLGDYFRSAALENNYVVGDKWYSTMVMEGLPSWGIAAITGNSLDIGDRLGAHGFEPLKQVANFLSGDASFQETSGAAFNLALPTMSAFGHILWAMSNDQYPLTNEDWIDLAKGITSVRSGWRFYMAAQYGEWLSKNGTLEATDVSKTKAAFMATLGLQPQEMSDNYLKKQVLHSRAKAQGEMSTEYLKNIADANRALQDNNTDLANKFFTRAAVIMQLIEPDRKLAVTKQAKFANQAVSERTDYDFYIKKQPAGPTKENLEAYSRTQELKQQGKQ